MSQINFPLPTDGNRQLLVGAVYGESTSAGTGGENEDEKRAIALVIVNMAYYATYLPDGQRRCYNTDFGNGSILSAIKKTIHAYDKPAWREVMANDALKSKSALEALDSGRIEHLRLAVVAVDAIGSLVGPLADPKLANRNPLQFNKAADSPPSPRQEKIGRLGSHTLYAFKSGRECQ